jgi:hypothetical protein
MLGWNGVLTFDFQGYTGSCRGAILVTRTAQLGLIEQRQGTHNDLKRRIWWDVIPKTIPAQK